jgi:hypothetical protein
MGAFILLLFSVAGFFAFPVLGGLGVLFAFWWASHWKVTVWDTVELIVFYGAVAGILVPYL